MCDIQVKESEWEGVRRKYWHGREQYYLPIVTWNSEYLSKQDQKEELQEKSLVDKGVQSSSGDDTKSGNSCEDVVNGSNCDGDGLKVKKQKIGDEH